MHSKKLILILDINTSCIFCFSIEKAKKHLCTYLITSILVQRESESYFTDNQIDTIYARSIET